jgi:hypothetical protein
MEQLGSHWTDFYEILYLSIFRNSVDKIKFSLKSDRNNGTLHEDLCAFMIISRSVLLRMRNVSGKVAEKMKTHLLFIQLLFSENRAVYEIMWENMVEPDRPQMTI